MSASQGHRLNATLPLMVLFAVLLVVGPSGCGGDDAVPATAGPNTVATPSGDGDSDVVAAPPRSTMDATPSNGGSTGSGSGPTDDLRLARDEAAVARAEARPPGSPL